jgi:sigma-B regulation protein RsbU (phosphoserine phosphatase)
VNAGHLPPIRIGGEGGPRIVETSGQMAVAVAEAIEYSSHSIYLAPKESLVLVTDGVTEAFAASGDQFGEKRLLACLKGMREEDPDQIAKTVLSTVQSFEQGMDQSDDITLLIVRRGGPHHAPVIPGQPETRSRIAESAAGAS